MITVCYACEIRNRFEMLKKIFLSDSMIKSWEAYRNTSGYVSGDLNIWGRVMDRHEVLHKFGH